MPTDPTPEPDVETDAESPLEYADKRAAYNALCVEILGGELAEEVWGEALGALHRYAVASGATPGTDVLAHALQKSNELDAAWRAHLAKPKEPS